VANEIRDVTPGTLFRSWLKRRGVKLVHDAYEHSPWLDVLDLAIGALRNPNPFLLQIGANDGLRDDPVHEIIRQRKLPALLIEPIPSFFADLQINYADCPQVRFANYAIGAGNGVQQLYQIAPGPDVPEWAAGVASFDRNALMMHRRAIPRLESRIQAVQVKVRTITALLAEYSCPTVDVLQVDCEGYDLEILRLCIDAGLRPPIINYEWFCLSWADQKQARELLAPLGYRFRNFDKDTLAVKLEASI
jgi:FkbM family methyltransferase